MSEYSIIFDQLWLWDVTKQTIIKQAAATISIRLSEYTGLSPEETFRRVFGVVSVRFTPSLTTLASASFSTIRFRHPAAVDLAMTIHEFGHLYGAQTRNRPTKQLWTDRNKLDTIAASYWPGCHPPSLPAYNVVERYCNLWEVWMMGLFNLSEAAVLCDDWMDANMPGWVAVAMERRR